MKEVKIGLLGYGTVGQGVVKLLKENAREIEAKIGARLVLGGVADLDIKSKREVPVDRKLLTTNASKLINDPDIPIIIELIGDHPAVKTMILDAFAAGKSVVTANKAILAKHGNQIYKAAERHGQDIYYEAAVAGTIPILRSLREGLAANRVQSIYGIVNGTCNYILTEMSHGRGSYHEILKAAQDRGYAEANPAADVEGYDAAHKLAILVRLGFGLPITLKQIHREGIVHITPKDIESAKEFGYVIKLLAIAKKLNGKVEARVHPTLIPEDSLLAQVNDAYNAVYVVGNFSGPTMYFGKGAGMEATASAVVGDVIELARNHLAGSGQRRLPSHGFTNEMSGKLEVMPTSEIQSQYYLKLKVKDQPGVLSSISGILGRNKISIRSVIQHGPEGALVPIVIITYKTPESALQTALTAIKALREVEKKSAQLLRIETEL